MVIKVYWSQHLKKWEHFLFDYQGINQNTPLLSFEHNKVLKMVALTGETIHLKLIESHITLANVDYQNVHNPNVFFLN